MSKKRILYHSLSVGLLTAPNIVYLLCNVQVLKEAHAVALTMTALLVLSIVGLGALAHFKANAGIWVGLIGVFVLSLSNIAYVAGVALIIEGTGIAIDGYAIKPLIKKEKIKELKEHGEQVTYTTDI